MIRREELSAAIFAPGWVFETQDKTKFIDNQNRCCICATDTHTRAVVVILYVCVVSWSYYTYV